MEFTTGLPQPKKWSDGAALWFARSPSRIQIVPNSNTRAAASQNFIHGA
jgi:hypothetical protein